MNLINLNSLPGQISNMQNRWDSFKRSLGATLEEPFMGSLKGIGAFITRLDESFARSRAGWEATWKIFWRYSPSEVGDGIRLKSLTTLRNLKTSQNSLRPLDDLVNQ